MCKNGYRCVSVKLTPIRFNIKRCSMCQCDGCSKKLPVLMGLHVDNGKPYMCCINPNYIKPLSYKLEELIFIIESKLAERVWVCVVDCGYEVVVSSVDGSEFKLTVDENIDSDIEGNTVFDGIYNCSIYAQYLTKLL